MFDIAMNTGDIEYLKALIAAGLPYDITFRGSATPVQKAIWSGNEDLVRFVCELGFSPLLENTNGESGLWMMIQYEKEEETLELCEYIQRNQFITPAGKSYLLHAIDHRQYRVAAELVKKGADVNYQDEKGNMVYDYCIKSDNQALFELCREYGMIIPEETSFHTTIDLPIDEHASRKKGDIIAWAYDPSDHSFWAIGHLQNEKFLSTAHSWLIHIDAEGNPVSMKMLARYTLKDSPSRVYLLSDNTILLIRTAFNYRYPYGYDMYISKYTKEGELIWSKVLKTDQNDIFLDSFLTENDLLYIVLSSQEKSKTNMQEALWLVRCNRDGEFHFSRKIGMYTHIIEAHIVERNHMCVIASLVEDEKACYAFIEGRGERGALLWKRGITAGHTDYIIDLCQGLNDNCLFAITERKKKESTLILASWSCHGDLLFSKEIIHDGHVHTHLIKRSGDYILFSYVKASKKNELQVTRLHADGRVMFSRSVSCNFDDGQICSGMTDRGGLIISGPDSRSRGFSTISCAEMIKFNELLGGVIGNIIKVEATEKELDYQPIE
jgi:ankyrin repeat protein